MTSLMFSAMLKNQKMSALLESHLSCIIKSLKIKLISRCGEEIEKFDIIQCDSKVAFFYFVIRGKMIRTGSHLQKRQINQMVIQIMKFCALPRHIN